LKYTNYQEHYFIFQIDKSILALMDINDSMLLKLIPHYGDRLAVLDFVKKTHSLKRKTDLYEKLSNKINANKKEK